VNLKWKLNYN